MNTWGDDPYLTKLPLQWRSIKMIDATGKMPDALLLEVSTSFVHVYPDDDYLILWEAKGLIMN